MVQGRVREMGQGWDRTSKGGTGARQGWGRGGGSGGNSRPGVPLTGEHNLVKVRPQFLRAIRQLVLACYGCLPDASLSSFHRVARNIMLLEFLPHSIIACHKKRQRQKLAMMCLKCGNALAVYHITRSCSFYCLSCSDM